MREASETRDHRFVAASIAEKVGVAVTLIHRRAVAQVFEQLDTAVLQPNVFSMLQRHVSEHALEAYQSGGWHEPKAIISL